MSDQTPEQAERDELDDQLAQALEDALAKHYPSDLGPGFIDFDVALLMTAIAPALAAIRRNAAADALKQQAAVLGQQSMNFAKRAGGRKIGTRLYDVDMAFSQQARVDARRLRRAADDVIAEGWTETCAQTTPATWDDPAEGCETPVENEGDFCPRHEPCDDYDYSQGDD